MKAGWYAALALTLLRLALAPLFLLARPLGIPGWLLVIMLVAAFLSDIFDGVVARRAGVATPFLRRLDSTVDTVFYLAVAMAAFTLHGGVMRANAPLIVAMIACEAGNYLFGWLKLGREPSYHAYSAKTFGLLLFASVAVLFATGSGALLVPALIVGFIAQLEVFVITLRLTQWRHDVRSVFLISRATNPSAPRPT